ncbi:MAG: DUF2840 domain-containing protein [Pseudomonadota bacterium]
MADASFIISMNCNIGLVGAIPIQTIVPNAVSAGPMESDAQDAPLTAVLISYRKNRRNHRILFGSPKLTIRRGWHRSMAAFAADQIFGYERWEANRFGTQSWHVYVCQASKRNAIVRIPGIQPGAHLLLQTSGQRRVQRVFGVLDQLQTLAVEVEYMPAQHWREIHNWIETGIQKEALLDLIRRPV